MSLVSVALSIRHYGTNIPSGQQDGLSQSVCGRKSFLFFRPRVSAVEDHFCFFITECQTTDANSLYRPYNIFCPVVRVRIDTGSVPTYGRSARVGLSIKPDSRNLYKTYT